VPQVIKTLRSGDTAAISLRMYLLFTSGIALWGIYGLLKGDGLLIVANAIPLVSAGLILHCKRWALLAGRRCRSAELGQPLALAAAAERAVATTRSRPRPSAASNKSSARCSSRSSSRAAPEWGSQLARLRLMVRPLPFTGTVW